MIPIGSGVSKKRNISTVQLHDIRIFSSTREGISQHQSKFRSESTSAAASTYTDMFNITPVMTLDNGTNLMMTTATTTSPNDRSDITNAWSHLVKLLAVVLANCTVMMNIFRHKPLKKTLFYLLASLAVTDVIGVLLTIPLLLVQLMPGK